MQIKCPICSALPNVQGMRHSLGHDYRRPTDRACKQPRLISVLVLHSPQPARVSCRQYTPNPRTSKQSQGSHNGLCSVPPFSFRSAGTGHILFTRRLIAVELLNNQTTGMVSPPVSVLYLYLPYPHICTFTPTARSVSYPQFTGYVPLLPRASRSQTSS